MVDFELIFEGRYWETTISASEKYMLLTKSKRVLLYDFKEKTLLREINVKDILYATFSADEDYIILQSSTSISIYSVSDDAVIKRILTGQAPAYPKIYGCKLIYAVRHKNWDSSIFCYDILTGKKQTLYRLPSSLVRSFEIHSDCVYITASDTPENTTYYVIKYDFLSEKTDMYSFEIKGTLLNTVAYSSYLSKLIYLSKIDNRPNDFALYSIDIQSGKTELLKEFIKISMPVEIRCCKNLLFISKPFAFSVFDLKSNDEHEFSLFPVALIHPCDNNDYFRVSNGEYSSVYKITEQN